MQVKPGDIVAWHGNVPYIALIGRSVDEKHFYRTWMSPPSGRVGRDVVIKSWCLDAPPTYIRYANDEERGVFLKALLMNEMLR